MSIPNFKPLVQRIYDTGDFDLSTLEGCGAFTRACAGPIHDADPRFVMLRKPAGRTHVTDAKGRMHAADALLFLDSGKGMSIDIIGNSRTLKATPSWTPDTLARYAAADGFVPDYTDVPPPPPQSPPSDDLAARVAVLEARVNRHLAP